MKEIKHELVVNHPSVPEKFSEQYLLKAFDAAKAEFKSFVPDVETKQGRSDIKQLAAKVKKTSSAISSAITDHLRDLKALPKILEANSRESKARFESLHAEIMKPLSDAQERQSELMYEVKFIIDHHDGMACIDVANERRGFVESVDVSDFWEEDRPKIKKLKQSALICIDSAIERIKKDNELIAAKKAAEEAELALRIEKERMQAEEKARNEQLQALAKAEKEKAEALEAKKIAEANAKMLAEQQEIAAKKAIEEANKQAQEAARQAVELEKKRALQKAEQERIETEKREANKQHRIKINREALADFISIGIDEETAKSVITAIARKQISNIFIKY